LETIGRPPQDVCTAEENVNHLSKALEKLIELAKVRLLLYFFRKSNAHQTQTVIKGLFEERAVGSLASPSQEASARESRVSYRVAPVDSSFWDIGNTRD
jgi:hypothetical protein